MLITENFSFNFNCINLFWPKKKFSDFILNAIGIEEPDESFSNTTYMEDLVTETIVKWY